MCNEATYGGIDPKRDIPPKRVSSFLGPEDEAWASPLGRQGRSAITCAIPLHRATVCNKAQSCKALPSCVLQTVSQLMNEASHNGKFKSGVVQEMPLWRGGKANGPGCTPSRTQILPSLDDAVEGPILTLPLPQAHQGARGSRGRQGLPHLAGCLLPSPYVQQRSPHGRGRQQKLSISQLEHRAQALHNRS